MGLEEFLEKMNQFMKWMREKHPEALPKLFESEDKFIYSRDNGLLLVKLAHEWRAAPAKKDPRSEGWSPARTDPQEYDVGVDRTTSHAVKAAGHIKF